MKRTDENTQGVVTVRTVVVAGASLGIALGVATMAGCVQPPKAGETLAESMRTYNQAIRWQRFEAAAARLPPAQRIAFVDGWDERAKDVKITDFEVVQVTGKGTKKARVQIKWSWYRDSEGMMRETQAVESWVRTGKVWWMTESWKLRGDTMPGLADEAPEDLDDDETAPDGSDRKPDGSNRKAQANADHAPHRAEIETSAVETAEPASR